MNREPAPSARPRRVFRRGDQSGAALVEFALVISLFVFILYGLISFGMILAQKQRITNAAAEAARSAVGESDSVSAVGAATARVNELLGTPGAYTATYDGAFTCDGLGLPNCIKVTIVYDYENHPIVPPAPIIDNVVPKSFQSSAVVQYK